MTKKDYKQEVLELIQSGCYDMVQQINNGPEEPYEGCMHNLYMILEDDEPTATLLEPSDPQAREGCKEWPPFNVLVHYLKNIYLYAIDHNLTDKHFDELDQTDLPFKWQYIPVKYPQPGIYIQEDNIDYGYNH